MSDRAINLFHTVDSDIIWTRMNLKTLSLRQNFSRNENFRMIQTNMPCNHLDRFSEDFQGNSFFIAHQDVSASCDLREIREENF